MSPFDAVGVASAFSQRIKFNCGRISFVPVTGPWQWNWGIVYIRAMPIVFGTGCMVICFGSASGLPTRFVV